MSIRSALGIVQLQLNGRIGRQRVEAAVNGGGPDLHPRTFGGDVRSQAR